MNNIKKTLLKRESRIYEYNYITTTSTTIAPTATTSSLTTSPSQHSSTWHSPVPYLFGGLAAMLGLIAFALLILACSYWKLSGQLQNEENAERDLESVVGEGWLGSSRKLPFFPVSLFDGGS